MLRYSMIRNYKGRAYRYDRRMCRVECIEKNIFGVYCVIWSGHADPEVWKNRKARALVLEWADREIRGMEFSAKYNIVIG